MSNAGRSGEGDPASCSWEARWEERLVYKPPQNASSPMSASSSITFSLSLGPAYISHPLVSLLLHFTAPMLIYFLCSLRRHLMKTPLQTTRSHTALCRRLPFRITLTLQCQKGMEVSTGPGTTEPLTSRSSSSGCICTPASIISAGFRKFFWQLPCLS